MTALRATRRFSEFLRATFNGNGSPRNASVRVAALCLVSDGHGPRGGSAALGNQLPQHSNRPQAPRPAVDRVAVDDLERALANGSGRADKGNGVFGLSLARAICGMELRKEGGPMARLLLISNLLMQGAKAPWLPFHEARITRVFALGSM